MCAQIGVDPLACGKGFWSNMLDIGAFCFQMSFNFSLVNVINIWDSSSWRTVTPSPQRFIILGT
eukprot:UN13000